MIEYKLDKGQSSDATAHLKDMEAVLKEVSTTYQILLDVINQQESALSSPSINHFRMQLRESIKRAINLSENISDSSAKLATISEQASKHLSAIEDHFSAALEKKAFKAKVL